MPSITQLEYIVAVDTARHFGRAALACQVSQPGLSAQIQKLEETLGTPIFDRQKKPIVPTVAGEDVLVIARSILREHQRLVHYCQSRGTELAGPFALAVVPTIAAQVLPLFLNSFAVKHPKVELSIREMQTDTILQQLRDDKIDAAIAATPLGERGMRERPLYYEPFHAYFAAGHPLLAKAKIRESQLDPQELWLLNDGHCLRTQVATACSRDNTSDNHGNVRFEAGNLDTLRQLVRKGDGYTLLPDLFVRQLQKSECRNHVRPMFKPVPTREVSLVFRRGHYKSDIIRALFDAIQEHLPDDVATSKRAAYNVLNVEA